MITKERKEMEFEEAPSGFVKLYNYKEPFMKFDRGFGYEGVLLFDGKTDKIQCHFCGQWFSQLGHHLHKEHNMLASEYKDEVGLLQTTALIGEELRAKLIQKNLGKRLKNLRPGKKKTRAEKEKIRKTLKANALRRETQNRFGTSPLQLI